ncbi:MAG: ABC transporter permease [Candidatus Hydrogenedentes bacterium]|nr:ABC transporter permease [Candidatus Hydrogenedentota bacterium]
MRKLIARHFPLVILAGLSIGVAILAPEFRTTDNLTRVMYRTAVVGIIATGQTLVILTGGIDLSVGSVAALCGMVAGLLMRDAGAPVPVAVAAGSLLGLFCGIFNGMLVTKGRIPPFIVTLGMMMVARGATLLISKGLTVAGFPPSFEFLGGGRGWWLPVTITLAISASFSVTLAFTRFGRTLYAIGGNLASARLSGINVDRMRTGAFALCSLLAGFGGVVLASRTSVASPTAGEGLELDAIAACVIGGASLMGGEGGMVGTLAGALIMNVLVNFCNLKKLDVYWQMVLVGGLIIVLVFYDNYRKRKAGLLKN